MKQNKAIKEKVLVIVGPTAIGKSRVAIELAEKLNGEIISADSMQVYKGMLIGTAKLDRDEMRGIKHHLIDIVEPTENFGVAEYQKLARQAIFNITKDGKLPILVGGSGLYVRAVIDKFCFPKGIMSSPIRQELEKLAENELGVLYEELTKIDPEAARNIHPNNTRRVIRALEIIKLTGKSYTEYHKNWKEMNSIYDVRIFGLNSNREKLYVKIDKRVERMFKEGLLDEVKKLTLSGKLSSTTSCQALGYREVNYYLKGQITLDETKRLIKQKTRNFAKRQLTWFRRDNRVKWINVEGKEPSVIADEILNSLNFGRESD